MTEKKNWANLVVFFYAFIISRASKNNNTEISRTDARDKSQLISRLDNYLSERASARPLLCCAACCRCRMFFGEFDPRQ